MANSEVDKGQYNVWSTGNSDVELDQFQLLEEKVEKLIEKTLALKTENDSLREKILSEESKRADLTAEIEMLKSGRDEAKKRIVSLLEKMDQVAD